MTSLSKDLSVITLRTTKSDSELKSRLGFIRGVQIIEDGHRIQPRNAFSTWAITTIFGLIRTAVGALLLPAILVLIWTCLLLSPLLIFSISALSSKYKEINAKIGGVSFRQTELRNLVSLVFVGIFVTTGTLLTVSQFTDLISFVLSVHLEIAVVATVLIGIRGIISLFGSNSRKPTRSTPETVEE